LIMTDRRKFLKTAALTSTALGLGLIGCNNENGKQAAAGSIEETKEPFKGGLVLSTWDAGIKANAAAWNALEKGGIALDMAEKGANDTEADITNLTVGLGGLPDREGHTTLDACIMNSDGMAGSVMFLEHIRHPASVARRVMEKTPHVQLVGEGAYQFAIEEGSPHDGYESPESKRAYQDWLKTSEYKTVVNIENHDTIGLLAMDRQGDIAGVCTTSGMAYKMRGRVGDSPIIGAGLYVDNEVGAATSSGLGEIVVRACGSFLIVELMRQGASPQEACVEAIKRIQAKNKNFKDFQVGFLAVNKAGEIGAYAIRPGFTYALHRSGENKIYTSLSLIQE
jgi:isoaspartyl peptidase/L-asparaginase-like protein (Ntn-hydrolase superfamily)